MFWYSRHVAADSIPQSAIISSSVPLSESHVGRPRSSSAVSKVGALAHPGGGDVHLYLYPCLSSFLVPTCMRMFVWLSPAGNQFIYRVSSLWLELGVSSVIVVGGCGDYFDVHNTAILVDNYAVSDATERAHSVSDPPENALVHAIMLLRRVGWMNPR